MICRVGVILSSIGLLEAADEIAFVQPTSRKLKLQFSTSVRSFKITV